ncbi:MAG: DUF4238 domain-containing protein [Asticcacaulis sp.]|uniref:DUF4238 domain-containing protein n=1 Tax=Asticcacaulis sp. TaxID=1872648 RepID=UPI0039E53079
MTPTRNNHYVPQWYQQGFFEPGRDSYNYLDIMPPMRRLPDGRTKKVNGLFKSTTTRCFVQRDLYSTFFGTTVNDEIERRLFGDIDTRGARAVRAFQGSDVAEWHRHFQTLFEFMDIQKLRTPKGLDWLKGEYPSLDQNDLMVEMQGIRMMHCSIWAGGVREIVSAEDAAVKFIVTDHPVTIYNHGISPEAKENNYPNDPSITQKGSQTIFPLNRNFCLILTNLEYAKNPDCNPLEKRTFARKYHSALTRTDAFIRTRKLTDEEVRQINYILKARASRYIAGENKDWLYPEQNTVPWPELRKTLLPPESELWRFGGEMFVKYESGEVHYQDEFGRSEKEREFLKKEVPQKPLRPRDECGCGSGRAYADCCQQKPVALRPTWSARSIRERNLMFLNGIGNVLELDASKDWLTVRRELTDEKISLIYHLYEGLWPLETDLFQLLPKPDGNFRGVYTGNMHPQAMTDFAFGACLYFGELIIQHPFIHAGVMNKKFSPIEHPSAYRQEFLKSLFLFINIMPLVEVGLVNLIPDPIDFDYHLRDQMMHMAKDRNALERSKPGEDPRGFELAKQDAERSWLSMPEKLLRSQIKKTSPEIEGNELDNVIKARARMRENDPLCPLQDWELSSGDDGGQMSMMKMVPNFEIAMYLAQATGACIVTDNILRWKEIERAVVRRLLMGPPNLPALSKSVAASTFAFPHDTTRMEGIAANRLVAAYPKLFGAACKYLGSLEERGPKPNVEASLNAMFNRTHAAAQKFIEREVGNDSRAEMACIFPAGGIQDNTVNRLLLMSNSEIYLRSVPGAFHIRR